MILHPRHTLLLSTHEETLGKGARASFTHHRAHKSKQGQFTKSSVKLSWLGKRIVDGCLVETAECNLSSCSTDGRRNADEWIACRSVALKPNQEMDSVSASENDCMPQRACSKYLTHTHDRVAARLYC